MAQLKKPIVRLVNPPPPPTEEYEGFVPDPIGDAKHQEEVTAIENYIAKYRDEFGVLPSVGDTLLSAVGSTSYIVTHRHFSKRGEEPVLHLVFRRTSDMFF